MQCCNDFEKSLRMKDYIISSSVLVRNGVAVCNGAVKYEHKGIDVAAFTKELYKELKTDYPKFFKMDNLCKLAFVSVELLLKDHSVDSHDTGKVALVLSNASASLDTDRTYFRSVEDKENYFPSPAVFVYTLPNIMMGEICIRHKFTGENTFFISEKFDSELLASCSENILSSEKASCVIAGWVEINGDEWESALFLVESFQNKSEQACSPKAMQEIYNSI